MAFDPGPDGHIASDVSGEAEKIRALRRTKTIATAALVLCFVVFLVARAYSVRWPWLALVAAFAEAATIGGLADWYAVVALFRRPMGLPIPHTAIIPSNQQRIADNLGRFIEANFLAPAPVREKLARIDYAALVADWLSDPDRAAGLSRFVGRLVPKALSAVEDSDLKAFVGQRLRDQAEHIDLAPLAADLLSAFTEDRRHQRLLDRFLKLARHYLGDEDALAALREKIRQELPSMFNLFRADAYLLKRIVASAASMIEEIENDPDHPMRQEFDAFVERFVDRLRHSRAYARRVERMKRDFLARPELDTLVESLWASLRAFVEQDMAGDDSRLRAQLARMMVEIGRQLADDPKVRADMNHGFVVALAAFVESQKSGVSVFIADQVKKWDLGQMTRLIEINIGRDLQYIRFNGMIIGGLAGVLLYLAEHLILAN